MRLYATPTDLNASPWNANLSTEQATTLLTHATPILEELTKTAIYTTNSQGLPTDPVIAAAFKDAACAQATYFIDTGDITGAAGRFNSLSLGSFSVSGGGVGSRNNESAAVQRFAPQAVQILANAGLIAHAPRSW